MYNLITLLSSYPTTVYKNNNLENPLSSFGGKMFIAGFSSIASEYVTVRFLAES